MVEPQILHDVTLPATGSDLGNESQDDVLCRHAGRQLTVHVHRHGLRPRLGQCLGREDVFDLRCTNTECDRPEGAVGGGVRVTADHGQSRLGQTELRADDVHDALVKITKTVDANAEVLRVLRSVSTWVRDTGSAMGRSMFRGSVCCDPR